MKETDSNVRSIITRYNAPQNNLHIKKLILGLIGLPDYLTSMLLRSLVVHETFSLTRYYIS